MTFAAPLWLIGLIPWAGVTLYLLRGRRRREAVPFLGLWIGPVTGPPAKQKVAAPPLAVTLALLAALLALFGAAGPRMKSGGHGARVRIVVDRGAGVSARGKGAPRFVEAAEEVAAELVRSAPSAAVEVQAVPGWGALRTGPSEWIGEVRKLSRTAVDSGAAIGAAVAASPQAADVVVIISDAAVTEGDRLIRVAPGGGVANAGIVHLSVRDAPRAQVMVRIKNDTTLRSARLEVTTAGRTTTADVELPPPGAEPRDMFVDLPGLGDVVAVRLVAEDSFEADNVAWLVREGSWPRIEPRVALSPELARMVDVYAVSRSSGLTSVSVAVVDDLSAIPPSMPAVIVAPSVAGTDSAAPAEPGPADVLPHPVTRNLEGDFRIPAIRLHQPAPDGWTPVVRIGGKVAVAVREAPVRQVWVGLESPQWATRPEYVVFWANVFDWVGGSGGPEFRAYPVGPLGAGWKRVDGEDVGAEPELWPGLYERAADGARRAVNSGEIRFPPPAAPSDWRGRLRAALARADHGLALGPGLLVAALSCLALAAVFWRRRRAGMS